MKGAVKVMVARSSANVGGVGMQIADVCGGHGKEAGDVIWIWEERGGTGGTEKSCVCSGEEVGSF